MPSIPAKVRLSQLLATLQVRADVRGIYLSGSLSRDDAPCDEFSDIDLTLFVADRDAFACRDWLASIAPVTFADQYTPRHWRILFEDGVLLEIGIFDADDVAEKHPLLGITGGRLMLDCAGLAEQLGPIEEAHAPYQWQEGDYGRNVPFLMAFYVLLLRRLKRGEVVSAYLLYGRFADFLLRIVAYGAADQHPAYADGHDIGRHFESRFPDLAVLTSRLLPSCEATSLHQAIALAVDLLEREGRRIYAAAGRDFPEEVLRGVRRELL